MYIKTPGAKMLYLIRRRLETSRDELVMHWFKNHMPAVIRGQEEAASAMRRHARKYIATLFDTPLAYGNREISQSGASDLQWDGMAQLWWDEPLTRPTRPHGEPPVDSFQERAMPYVPWATQEYVVLDGSEHLSAQPLSLNDPYPMTRSGFCRASFLVAAKPGTDFKAFFEHWLEGHVANVKSVMLQVGGFRYVVSHSLEPELEPFAGLAELYFQSARGLADYFETIENDGMEQWVDGKRTLIFRGSTEMVGIP